MENVLITDTFGLLAVLLIVPAIIFIFAGHKTIGKFFAIVPPLVFAYFVPTLLSTFSIIPSSSPIYTDIKTFVLPASLILLTLAVDIKGIFKLGYKAIVMFLAGTFGVVIGAPIAYLFFKSGLPDEAWKGMAALSGSH